MAAGMQQRVRSLHFHRQKPLAILAAGTVAKPANPDAASPGYRILHRGTLAMSSHSTSTELMISGRMSSWLVSNGE